MTTINNSENLIEKVGGIEMAREIAFDPLYPQMTHVSNDGRHWVNEAFAHIPEIRCQIESMIRINDLRTAIAEHDREFKVGDLVVSTWGLEKRVLKIVLKPKFKNGILYLTLLIDGVKRECLAQWWRQATNEEIALGFRS